MNKLIFFIFSARSSWFIVTLVLLAVTLMCFFSLITTFMAQTTTHNENKSSLFDDMSFLKNRYNTTHVDSLDTSHDFQVHMYNIKIYLQLRDMILHLIFALHAKNGEQKLIETKKRQRTNSSKNG